MATISEARAIVRIAFEPAWKNGTVEVPVGVHAEARVVDEQVEIWFSILHRRVLQHGDFATPEQRRGAIDAFVRPSRTSSGTRNELRIAGTG